MLPTENNTSLNGERGRALAVPASYRWKRADWVLLLLIWLAATAININKAFHIDDSFHLEAAQWVSAHPSQPMHGYINWEANAEPLYISNQPPLFYYLIALTGRICGYGEWPLHLMLSVFSFLALFYFYKIARQMKVHQPKVLLLLFAFCPAFIANQNLMVDVPILALMLGSCYYLLKAGEARKALNYSMSALLLGIGLLIKYSLLPVFPVLLLVILLRKDFKYLLSLLIPLVLLGAWSVWNYQEFGYIHILHRNIIDTQLYEHFKGLAVCLGGITVFSVALLYAVFPYKLTKGLMYALAALFVLSVVLFVTGSIDEPHYAEYLDDAFMVNGLAVVAALLLSFFWQIRQNGLGTFLRSDAALILLFLLANGAFIIRYAPFMATRHVLLILPFLLLFLQGMLYKGRSMNALLLPATIVLGLLLSISDWMYADFYRQAARNIVLPKNKTVWTAGHWGWQWYARQRGWQQYNRDSIQPVPGDYFITPINASHTKPNDSLHLKLVDKKWQEPGLATLFYVADFANLYASYYWKGPWRLSRRPVDTIAVYEVVGADGKGNSAVQLPDSLTQPIYAFMRDMIIEEGLNMYNGLTLIPASDCYDECDSIFLKRLLKTEEPEDTIQYSSLFQPDTLKILYEVDGQIIERPDEQCLTKEDIDYMLKQRMCLRQFQWDNTKLWFNVSNRQSWYVFSVPLFSKDHKTAVMKISDLCSLFMCGSGKTMLFKNEHGKWKGYEIRSWIH